MKVFLAGLVELPRGVELLKKHRPLYVLDAYKYSKKLPDYNIYDYVEDFLLDSGAFTVINAFFKKGKKTSMDWNSYADKYADYVKAVGAKHYFELDIDCIIPYTDVLRLRKRIEDRVGWQSIPVWHGNRGTAEFTKMCKDYKYVAIGSKFQNKKYLKYFIDEAHRYGTKLHGLGYTRMEKLGQFNFDTVDSTTWLNGPKYGNLAVFDGHRVKDINHGKMYRKAGTEACQNLTEHCLKEWMKFQKYAKDNL